MGKTRFGQSMPSEFTFSANLGKVFAAYRHAAKGLTNHPLISIFYLQLPYTGYALLF